MTAAADVERIHPDHRLPWLREQLGQLQDAATMAKQLADRNRPRVEQARLTLVELESQQAALDADHAVRIQRVNDFKQEHPDV